MDPNACWQRMVDALIEGNTVEAINASIDLSIWLNRGGMFPDVRHTDPVRYVWAVLTFMCELDPDDKLRNAEGRE